MSEGNVELVERLIDAWNRQDIDGMLALADPDVEYVNAPVAVEPGTRRGLNEVGAVFRAQWESLSGARLELVRTHVRGDEVISEGRVSRAMPGSDARIENRILMSWTFRAGAIVRLEVLGAGSSFDEALERTGLEERRPE